MCSRLFLMTLHLKSLHVQNNFRKIHTIGNPLRYMTKQMCAVKNSPLSTFCKLHTHCLPSIIYWATSPWKILLPQQNQTCKLLIIHLLAQHKYSIKKQKICRRKKSPKMGGTVTFLCPSALYNFCYQAGVTPFVLSFINYYGVECLFINLQGQVRCSKCRHIGWGCADLSLTESAGWFRWNQWQLKSADGELIEQLSLWAHTQTKQVNKQMDGIMMICMKHIAT